jgi:hypothetical protein
VPEHQAWRRVAGSCSLAAGLLHAGLTPEHFEAWWGYGAFFVAAAIAQVVLGIGLLSDAFRAHDAGPGALAWDRRMVLAGLAGQLLLVAFYAWTRLVGVPWLGPEAGEVEAVGLLDLPTKALELASAAALAVVAARGLRAPAPGEARATPGPP